MGAHMSFEAALSTLLGMVGERVEVHLLDIAASPHVVASFAGTLEGGYTLPEADPGEPEALHIRLSTGEEFSTIVLDRHVFKEAMLHEDGALNLQLGAVALIIAPG